MAAREWFDGQMYPLMSFKIMVAVEALRALVASERPVVLRTGLLWVTVELLDMCSMPTIEALHHTVWHTAYHLKLAIWVAHIGKNRTRKWISIRSGVRLLRVCLRWRYWTMTIDW